MKKKLIINAITVNEGIQSTRENVKLDNLIDHVVLHTLLL